MRFVRFFFGGLSVLMSEKPIKLKDITLQDDVEQLVILRKRLNKDQHQFANELNITSKYLSAVENYRSPFSKRYSLASKK